jgi:hypothetical protein
MINSVKLAQNIFSNTSSKLHELQLYVLKLHLFFNRTCPKEYFYEIKRISRFQFQNVLNNN